MAEHQRTLLRGEHAWTHLDGDGCVIQRIVTVDSLCESGKSELELLEEHFDQHLQACGYDLDVGFGEESDSDGDNFNESRLKNAERDRDNYKAQLNKMAEALVETRQERDNCCKGRHEDGLKELALRSEINSLKELVSLLAKK